MTERKRVVRLAAIVLATISVTGIVGWIAWNRRIGIDLAIVVAALSVPAVILSEKWH